MDLVKLITEYADSSITTLLFALVIYLIKLHRQDLMNHRNEYHELVRSNTEAMTRLGEGIDHLKDRIK